MHIDLEDQNAKFIPLFVEENIYEKDFIIFFFQNYFILVVLKRKHYT